MVQLTFQNSHDYRYIIFSTQTFFTCFCNILFLFLTKFKVNLNNILLGIKGSIYVLTPYIVYRFMILSFGYEFYDGLTKKWGQFIWILDFQGKGSIRK